MSQVSSVSIASVNTMNTSMNNSMNKSNDATTHAIGNVLVIQHNISTVLIE
jgi:hypothetical protein